MTFLTKGIYRFHVILINIPILFFRGINNPNAHGGTKHKGKTKKKSSTKKNTVNGITISDVKLYYRVIVRQTTSH